MRAEPGGLAPASARTMALGVIGDPIDHSLSPRLHELMIARAGVDARYLPLAVRAADLEAALRGMRALGIRGINVTAPHKLAALPYLDRAGGDAARIGAVNTICREDDGSLSGHNTDPQGLEAALRAAAGVSWTAPGWQGGAALILGSGGAARAALLALSRLGFVSLFVAGRRPEQAAVLAAFGASLGGAAVRALGLSATELAALTSSCSLDLIVQATSCGCGAQAALSPWPQGLPIPAATPLLDLVYGRQPTPFLRQGGERWVMDGLPMLIWQGAHALQHFTGATLPPIAVARAWERQLRQEGV